MSFNYQFSRRKAVCSSKNKQKKTQVNTEPLSPALIQTRIEWYKVKREKSLWPAGSILTLDIIENITVFFSLKTHVLHSVSLVASFFPSRSYWSSAVGSVDCDSPSGLSATAAVAPATSGKLHWTFLLIFFLSFFLLVCRIYNVVTD